jgi:hypothetical protein
MRFSRSARILAALVALAAWVGLIVQFDASFTLMHSAAGALSAMLRYFTIVTNILVAIVFTLIAIGTPRIAPSLMGCTVLAIVLVGIIYALLLRGLVELSGGAKLADLLLHSATPLLVPLFWLAFAPKGGLRWHDPLVWMAMPLAYFIYALIRVQIDGIYAYPFMNAAEIGWARTMLNALVIAVGFLIAGVALVWLDQRMAKANSYP